MQLRIEPHPDYIGTRGAILGWRVVRTIDNQQVFFAMDRGTCRGFVQGVEFAVENAVLSVAVEES